MINMTDLNLLSDLHQRLSSILELLQLLTSTTRVWTSKKKEFDGGKNLEILEFVEPKNDAMYKQSKFYKMFDKLTARPRPYSCRIWNQENPLPAEV